MLPENIWQLWIFTPGMSAFPPAIELMPMPLSFCAGDYARHMRAVAGIVDVVPRDDARVLDEVVAVDVALIAVAVVILVRAVDFVLVDPHVVLQIGVLDHHALVEYGHDDRLVARREFPRLLALHVGVHDGFPAEHVAAVHEVPLLRKQQVVEGIGRGFARPGRALVLDGFERLAGEGHRLFPGVVGAGGWCG